MTPSEVQQALRLITSPEFKRTNRFPISVIANLAGLSRNAVYFARNGKMLTPRVVAVLSPILTDILNGTSICFRGRWLWSVRQGGREERQFSVERRATTLAGRAAKAAQTAEERLRCKPSKGLAVGDR